MNYVHFILITSTIVLIVGCNKNDSVSSNTTGSIDGVIQLRDASYNLLSDFSNVTVSIENPSISTQSDEDGSWVLRNIPPGVYNITFSKDGYFSLRWYNFQFVGSGTYYMYPQELQQIPQSKITNLKAVNDDRIKTTHFTGTISPPDSNRNRFIELLLSKKPFPNSVPLESYGAFVTQNHFISYYDASYDFYIYPEFESGDTLYAVAIFGDNTGGPVQYNPATRMSEFITPGDLVSNQVKFVVP